MVDKDKQLSFDPEDEKAFNEAVDALAKQLGEDAAAKVPESALRSAESVAAEQEELVRQGMMEYRDRFARGYQALISEVVQRKRKRSSPGSSGGGMIKI